MTTPSADGPHPIVVECHIPSLAARAVRIQSIALRAGMAGITEPKCRYTTTHVAVTETRITTDINVARFLLEKLRECATELKRERRHAATAAAAACKEGAATLARAIDAAAKRQAPPRA